MPIVPDDGSLGLGKLTLNGEQLPQPERVRVVASTVGATTAWEEVERQRNETEARIVTIGRLPEIVQALSARVEELERIVARLDGVPADFAHRMRNGE